MLKSFKKIKEYIKVSDAAPISRRYFVMNSFDGSMTILGIILGAYIVRVNNVAWIISTGIGAAIAMGISGVFGAYLTEEAERARIVHSLEKAMLKKLDKTIIGRSARFATIWTALIDGISPLLAALVCLSPLFLTFVNFIAIADAIFLSIVTTFVVLFMLGVFLGRTSRKNVFIHGMKMLLAGLILLFILFFFKLYNF
jgi:predicted membrane protein (TIGR00267 family)